MMNTIQAKHIEIYQKIQSDFYKNTNFEELLHKVEENAQKHGLPDIAITNEAGRNLSFVASSLKAKDILEIGTLAGFSTLYLSQGAPLAKITTIEYLSKHANVAKQNFELAGVQDRISVINDSALKVLKQLVSENKKFDLIFLDANKEQYSEYLQEIKKLVKPDHSILITDNLVPKNDDPNDPITAGILSFNHELTRDAHLETTTITYLTRDHRLDMLGMTTFKA